MSQPLQTVKFKALSAELTDKEFDEFLCSLRRAKGREFILRSLCQQQQHPSSTADLLQIVSNIIQQRESQQQAHNPWALDTLPKSFIGEIASNFNQKDYARFSRTNRAIYIGCNDPNRLLSLSFPRKFSLSLIRFDRYPHLQKLEISASALPFPNGNSHILGQLKFISFHDIEKESDWLSIAQQTALESPKLRRLCFHWCTFPSTDIARQIFTKFNMVQHLYLRSTQLLRNISMPRALVAAAFPSLNSLMVHYSDMMAMAFLKYRGPNLFQLDLGTSPSLLFNELKEINFLRLRRLRIHVVVSSEIVQHIVKSASNLENACYTASSTSRADENDEMSQFINTLLMREENFNDLFLSLHRPEQLECASKAIQCALQNTRKWKRKLLRIGLQYFHLLEVNEAVVVISRILNRLSLCNIDEYALFAKLRSGEDKQREMIQDVQDLVDNLENVELVRSEGCVFIIRSKGSKINAFKMWWNEGGPYESRMPIIY